MKSKIFIERSRGIRLNPEGAAFFFLSLFLLTAGILLKQLIPFTAGLFLLLVLCAFTARFVYILIRLDSPPVPPSLPGRVSDGKQLSDLHNREPKHADSLIRIHRIDLEWGSYRSVRLKTQLSPAGESGTSRFLRGRYRILSNRLILCDSTGFLRKEVREKGGQELTVYPEPLSGKGQLPILVPSSSGSSEKLSFTRNNDFFESRPYCPGDDPRRLNWNLMARHGGLFIREGAFAAPVRKSVLVILNGAVPEKRGTLSREAFGMLDRLVRTAAGLISYLLGEGINVSGVLSGAGPDPVSLDTLQPEERETLLAGLPPKPLPSPRSAGSYGYVYLFSLAETLPEPGRVTYGGGQSCPRTLFTAERGVPAGSDRLKSYVREGWHVSHL